MLKEFHLCILKGVSYGYLTESISFKVFLGSMSGKALITTP